MEEGSMFSKGCSLLIIIFVALVVKIHAQGDIVIYNPNNTERRLIKIIGEVNKLDDLRKAIKKKYPNHEVTFGRLWDICQDEKGQDLLFVEPIDGDDKNINDITEKQYYAYLELPRTDSTK
jgi:hypothetical protein